MSDEDDDNVYDGRQHYGKRFLEPRQLADYVKALRPDLSWMNEHVLEALERERVLLPVLRVRRPPAVERALRGEGPDWAYHDPSLEVAADNSAELAAAISLLRAENLWHSPTHAPAVNPLDDSAADFARFFEDPATTPFQDWKTFRCPIGKHEDNTPLYGDHAVDTYYHYWHAFVAAEAAGMSWSIHFNVLDSTLRGALHAGDFKAIKEQAYYFGISNGRTLSKLLAHSACFNAIAWDQMYGGRVRTLEFGDDRILSGKRLDALREREREVSREAVARFAVGPNDLLAFMRMLAELWHRARDKERRRLARHYRRGFSAAYRVYQNVTGHDYDTIVGEVGPFDGYPKPIIKVLFPDWAEETQRQVLGTVQSCCREWTEQLHGDPKLTKQDATTLVAWLGQQGMLAVSWRIKHANAVWRDTSEVGIAGLAKEVEGLAANLEQIVGGIVREWGLFTVFKKLWQSAAMPTVHRELLAHKELSRTTEKPFRDQLAEVERLDAVGSITKVTAVLLRATLVRNHGAHIGLSDEEPQNLWDYFRWLVMALALAWSQARDQGLLTLPPATP